MLSSRVYGPTEIRKKKPMQMLLLCPVLLLLAVVGIQNTRRVGTLGPFHGLSSMLAATFVVHILISRSLAERGEDLASEKRAFGGREKGEDLFCRSVLGV